MKINTKIQGLLLATALASVSATSFAASIVEGQPVCSSTNNKVVVKVKGDSSDSWNNVVHVAVIDSSQGWLWDRTERLNSYFTTIIEDSVVIPDTARMLVWDENDTLREWYDCN